VSGYPDHLDPERHRDTKGREHQPWIRRAVLTLFTAVAVLGLLDVFGQRSSTGRAATAAATLEVRGPTTVRGGLLFQERITVTARRDISTPRLVLSKGWADGLQINTIEPQPGSESTRDGRLVLSYDDLPAGQRLIVYVDYQVNPTHVGNTDMGLELDERTTPLVVLPRTLTTFP